MKTYWEVKRELESQMQVWVRLKFLDVPAEEAKKIVEDLSSSPIRVAVTMRRNGDSKTIVTYASAPLRDMLAWMEHVA